MYLSLEVFKQKNLANHLFVSSIKATIEPVPGNLHNFSSKYYDCVGLLQLCFVLKKKKMKKEAKRREQWANIFCDFAAYFIFLFW